MLPLAEVTPVDVQTLPGWLLVTLQMAAVM